MSAKDTNPKDLVGVKKVGLSCVPMAVMYEAALGMKEGALKYGRFNWREKGVLASVYTDAAHRHIDEFTEGRDLDVDSKVHNITKAICCLMVLRDSMLFGNFVDDRPPPMREGWLQDFNAKAGELIDKYPNPAKPVLAKPEVLGSRDPDVIVNDMGIVGGLEVRRCHKCGGWFSGIHLCDTQGLRWKR